MPDHPVADGVQPDEPSLAFRYLVDAAPHRQEHIGDGVVDGVGKSTAIAVGADRAVVARYSRVNRASAADGPAFMVLPSTPIPFNARQDVRCDT